MGASWRYFRCTQVSVLTTPCSIHLWLLAPAENWPLGGHYSTGANKLAEPLLICANTKGSYNHELSTAVS